MTNFIDYLKFIGKQLTHLQPWSYWLWFAGVGFQLAILTTEPFNFINVVSFFGAVLGLLCVISIAACKAVNGWLGIISGICFMIVAFSAKNYLTIFEQLGYIVTLDIPVLRDLDWNRGAAKKVTHLDALQWFETIGATAVLWAVSAYCVQIWTNDPRPVIDALVFSLSVAGGILTWAKFSENFIMWTLVGLAQVLLWWLSFRQGNATIAMLASSCFYLANDGIGFTISPWFNKKTNAKAQKDDKIIYNE